MFINYEYFANQTLDADSGSKWIILIFSQFHTQTSQFSAGITSFTFKFKNFGSTQGGERTEDSFLCIRPLRKWVQMSAVFYQQCAF